MISAAAFPGESVPSGLKDVQLDRDIGLPPWRGRFGGVPFVNW
jgi:hypothetical protein